MRQRALDLGYSLNEHGLSKMDSGKKGEKVDIDFPTEESIFTFLGMKYKEPKQREGYKSVELLDKTASIGDKEKKASPEDKEKKASPEAKEKKSSSSTGDKNKTLKVLKEYNNYQVQHICK